MMELRPAAERGLANFGWLHSQHSFSFGSYYDPQHPGFSDLLVINEDRVRPGPGFRHPWPSRHGDLFLHPRRGARTQGLDGHRLVIRPGDVQMMSAGTGVRHSEYNASREQEVHFLQIWIQPDRLNAAPDYAQKAFDPAARREQWGLLASPDGAEGSLAIRQDARLLGVQLGNGESVTRPLETGPDIRAR